MEVVLVNNQTEGTTQGGTAVYTNALYAHLKKRGLAVSLRDSQTEISDVVFVQKLAASKKPRGKIIHAQLPIFAVPFCMNKKNKIVITLHGDNIKAITRKKGKITGKLYMKAESFALRRADAIIAVDKSTEAIYKKRFPSLKIHTIPVGVNLDVFKLMDRNEMRKKYNLDGYIILYVGRLREDKGIDIILESFKTVKDKMKDARLVIVGDGKDADIFKKTAQKIGNVEFLGPLPYGKIPEIMNCADLFVLASAYESGPLVIQEALACGVPCVTTDVGRVREFILSNECGRIVERDKDAMASAITEMKSAPVNREACREAVANQDFSATVQKTVNIYNTLINK